MPAISVILPVYNGGQFLRSAIESVLSQTYPDFELIVINDGSTDDTAETIASFQDERLRLIEHDNNLGLINSLNEAILLSQGEFLARMDADDVCLPQRFERQVNFLRTHPQVGILGGQVRFLDENLDQVVWEYRYPLRHAEIAWKLMFMNIIAHPAVMLRRELFHSAQSYDPGYPTAEDYQLWTRIITQTEFANLDEEVLLYRRHSGAVSEQKKQVQVATTLHIRRQYIYAATGLELSDEQLRMLFQSPPFDHGLAHDEFKTFVDLLVQIFSAYQKRHALQPVDLDFILADLDQHIQSVYVKPFIVTEQVVVMREPTKDELRQLMIANMPRAWQRIYGLLRRLRLISNPLPKDYYEE